MRARAVVAHHNGLSASGLQLGQHAVPNIAGDLSGARVPVAEPRPQYIRINGKDRVRKL
jgi:hypothetical protein